MFSHGLDPQLNSAVAIRAVEPSVFEADCRYPAGGGRLVVTEKIAMLHS